MGSAGLGGGIERLPTWETRTIELRHDIGRRKSPIRSLEANVHSDSAFAA
jgi:hypothetical protein